MRTLIIAFSLLLSGVVFGQSLYQPCVKGGDFHYRQNFEVKVNQTAYGISFESGNPCLTDDLKSGIRKFFDKTTYRQFHKMGDHTLHIVKDRERYYVVEQEKPLKLFKL